MSLENTKLLITPNGYKAGKLYSALPESGAGDSTFERATTATRVDADGLIEEVGLNVPRVDYPVSGGCPSLLLEPQRTNLLSYSEDFSDASWIKSNLTITANATTAPDGTLNADKITEDSANGVHILGNNISLLANQKYTCSVFVKKDDRSQFIIGTKNSSNWSSPTTVLFDLDSVSASNFSGTADNFSIDEFPNNWFRCSATFTFGASDAVGGFNAGLALNGEIPYQGDGTSGIFIWGAQLEQGSTATSYIPTAASTVTRNTDVLSNDMTATVNSTYTALLDVSASDSRLKIEDGTTGFDLPLNGSGRIVMVVDNDIKFYFPDNGQATTVLTYAKPSDLRNIDVLSKINETKIKVIAVENGVALQSRIDSWVSGSVSSYFIDTDWSLQTNFVTEFINQDWDYFPLINTSSGTSFIAAWRDNNLTSFPLINTSNGTSFEAAWLSNNLTSFPLINTSNGTSFNSAWLSNNLTSFPLINTSNGINFAFAWQGNNLTSFPRLNMNNGIAFIAAWENNNLTTWLPNYFDTCVGTNFDRAWFNNAIDQTGVDNILISITVAATTGVQTGTTKVIGLNGGTNATPSATGQAATDQLRADGWTVNLNGY